MDEAELQLCVREHRDDSQGFWVIMQMTVTVLKQEDMGREHILWRKLTSSFSSFGFMAQKCLIVLWLWGLN